MEAVSGSRMTDQYPRTTELAIIAAITYLSAILLLLLPAFMFALGVQAAGDAAGLWVGDPNSDDGEETWALGFGAVLITVVLVIAALVLRAVGRRLSASAAPSIVMGTLLIVALIAALCVATVVPAS